MNINETLAYIHSVSNFFCRPGLERIGYLCDKLGNPQNELSFVHVAGTNGKGSFCAMLSSVLRSAGYKTGLYTSPYILEFNERIMVDGSPINDNELCEITEKVKIIADSMNDKPTEFEVITAIAFEYFKKIKCDIVVLECGLGGRYDATNIISKSILSVITGISIDHTSFLGNTIEKIAGEKAGIIKENGLCLWCSDNEIAQQVISDECNKRNAKMLKVDNSSLNVKKYDLSSTVFDYKAYYDIKLPLLGAFQPFNAINVISAVEILNSLGYKIDENALKEGIAATIWRARFEIISQHPLIIADGGHNAEGISASVDSIKLYFGNTKVNIVAGVMKDKDYNYIADLISSVAKKVYCVTPNNPRALGSKEFANEFIKRGVEALAFDSVDEAIRIAKNDSLNDSVPLITLGSLYMYKEVFEAVNNAK